jgi:hypothetical protein
MVMLAQLRQTIHLSTFSLSTKNVEQNCRPQRVANEANFSIEIRISFYEELVDTITLAKDNLGNVFSVSALIEENIQC